MFEFKVLGPAKNVPDHNIVEVTNSVNDYHTVGGVYILPVNYNLYTFPSKS